MSSISYSYVGYVQKTAVLHNTAVVCMLWQTASKLQTYFSLCKTTTISHLDCVALHVRSQQSQSLQTIAALHLLSPPWSCCQLPRPDDWQHEPQNQGHTCTQLASA